VLSTLVDTESLAAHLDDPAWAIVDCRFNLADTEEGERLYADGHIPGAVYAHLDRDLSAPKTGTNGRHPLPSVEAMAAMLGRLGIEGSTQVVAYDQDTSMYAARLWWMLRYLGHEAVAVLDGGMGKWLREGRPMRDGIEARRAARFTAQPRAQMLALADEVLASLGAGRTRIVDARAPERYRGDVEPLDPVAGHVPGAVNHHYMANLAPDGTFLPADELRRRLEPVLGGAPATSTYVYCGSGVSACHDILALELAGLGTARLYAGSWSEWCVAVKGDTHLLRASRD